MMNTALIGSYRLKQISVSVGNKLSVRLFSRSAGQLEILDSLRKNELAINSLCGHEVE